MTRRLPEKINEPDFMKRKQENNSQFLKDFLRRVGALILMANTIILLFLTLKDMMSWRFKETLAIQLVLFVIVTLVLYIFFQYFIEYERSIR
jgi:uncharacterized membrane protein